MPFAVVLREVARIARREAAGLSVHRPGPLARAGALASARDVRTGRHPEFGADLRRRERDLEAAGRALTLLAADLERAADDPDRADRAAAGAGAPPSRAPARAV